ncbi:hypothetical protein BDF14DRAFT_1881199 [Spinellus fusiger]|nr:hypothetical protein BDF14DRAFT_1881199 [Spinellus fusiger]
MQFSSSESSVTSYSHAGMTPSERDPLSQLSFLSGTKLSMDDPSWKSCHQRLPIDHQPRKRTRASPEQLSLLEKTFSINPSPNNCVREQLSQQLGMSERSIQIWFQNRRAKVKNMAKRSSLLYDQTLRMQHYAATAAAAACQAAAYQQQGTGGAAAHSDLYYYYYYYYYNQQQQSYAKDSFVQASVSPPPPPPPPPPALAHSHSQSHSQSHSHSQPQSHPSQSQSHPAQSQSHPAQSHFQSHSHPHSPALSLDPRLWPTTPMSSMDFKRPLLNTGRLRAHSVGIYRRKESTRPYERPASLDPLLQKEYEEPLSFLPEQNFYTSRMATPMSCVEEEEEEKVPYKLSVDALQIGTWKRMMLRSHDLVCYFDPSCQSLVWRIQDGQRFQLKVHLATIQQIRLLPMDPPDAARLEIQVTQPENIAFYMEDGHQWTQCRDFTQDRQATTVCVHQLEGSLLALRHELTQLSLQHQGFHGLWVDLTQPVYASPMLTTDNALMMSLLRNGSEKLYMDSH